MTRKQKISLALGVIIMLVILLLSVNWSNAQVYNFDSQDGYMRISPDSSIRIETEEELILLRYCRKFKEKQFTIYDVSTVGLRATIWLTSRQGQQTVNGQKIDFLKGEIHLERRYQRRQMERTFYSFKNRI